MNYNIEVGDRVTYRCKNEAKINYQIIVDSDAQIEDFKQQKDLEILKIERPKYEVIEEKKELLTKEEKEFLKVYFKLTDLEYDSIKRNNDNLYLYLKDSIVFMKIELNDSCFHKLKENTLYTLQELGLEEN